MTNELIIPEKRPIIFPLCSPSFHWDTLLREGFRLTGQKFSTLIDEHRIKLKQDQFIISALAQFYRNSINIIDPYYEIRRANSTLEHLHFAFLCQYELATFIRLITHTHVKGSPHWDNNEVWILSGTLLEWKRALIELSSIDHSFSMRFFMNCMLVIFQCNGYQTVFDAYSRIQHPDGTFTLEEK